MGPLSFVQCCFHPNIFSTIDYRNTQLQDDAQPTSSASDPQVVDHPSTTLAARLADHVNPIDSNAVTSDEAQAVTFRSAASGQDTDCGTRDDSSPCFVTTPEYCPSSSMLRFHSQDEAVETQLDSQQPCINPRMSSTESGAHLVGAPQSRVKPLGGQYTAARRASTQSAPTGSLQGPNLGGCTVVPDGEVGVSGVPCSAAVALTLEPPSASRPASQSLAGSAAEQRLLDSGRPGDAPPSPKPSGPLVSSGLGPPFGPYTPSTSLADCTADLPMGAALSAYTHTYMYMASMGSCRTNATGSTSAATRTALRLMREADTMGGPGEAGHVSSGALLYAAGAILPGVGSSAHCGWSSLTQGGWQRAKPGAPERDRGSGGAAVAPARTPHVLAAGASLVEAGGRSGYKVSPECWTTDAAAAAAAAAGEHAGAQGGGLGEGPQRQPLSGSDNFKAAGVSIRPPPAGRVSEEVGSGAPVITTGQQLQAEAALPPGPRLAPGMSVAAGIVLEAAGGPHQRWGGGPGSGPGEGDPGVVSGSGPGCTPRVGTCPGLCSTLNPTPESERGFRSRSVSGYRSVGMAGLREAFSVSALPHSGSTGADAAATRPRDSGSTSRRPAPGSGTPSELEAAPGRPQWDFALEGQSSRGLSKYTLTTTDLQDLLGGGQESSYQEQQEEEEEDGESAGEDGAAGRSDSAVSTAAQEPAVTSGAYAKVPAALVIAAEAAVTSGQHQERHTEGVVGRRQQQVGDPTTGGSSGRQPVAGGVPAAELPRGGIGCLDSRDRGPAPQCADSEQLRFDASSSKKPPVYPLHQQPYYRQERPPPPPPPFGGPTSRTHNATVPVDGTEQQQQQGGGQTPTPQPLLLQRRRTLAGATVEASSSDGALAYSYIAGYGAGFAAGLKAGLAAGAAVAGAAGGPGTLGGSAGAVAPQPLATSVASPHAATAALAGAASEGVSQPLRVRQGPRLPAAAPVTASAPLPAPSVSSYLAALVQNGPAYPVDMAALEEVALMTVEWGGLGGAGTAHGGAGAAARMQQALAGDAVARMRPRPIPTLPVPALALEAASVDTSALLYQIMAATLPRGSLAGAAAGSTAGPAAGLLEGTEAGAVDVVGSARDLLCGMSDLAEVTEFSRTHGSVLFRGKWQGVRVAAKLLVGPSWAPSGPGLRRLRAYAQLSTGGAHPSLLTCLAVRVLEAPVTEADLVRWGLPLPPPPPPQSESQPSPARSTTRHPVEAAASGYAGPGRRIDGEPQPHGVGSRTPRGARPGPGAGPGPQPGRALGRLHRFLAGVLRAADAVDLPEDAILTVRPGDPAPLSTEAEAPEPPTPRTAALAALRLRPRDRAALVVTQWADLGDLGELLQDPVNNPFKVRLGWSAQRAARAALATAREIAEALMGLHSAGLAHGAVKPSNVLLFGCPFDLRCFVSRLGGVGPAPAAAGHPDAAGTGGANLEDSAAETEVMATAAALSGLLEAPERSFAEDVYGFGMLLYFLAAGGMPSPQSSWGTEEVPPVPRSQLGPVPAPTWPPGPLDLLEPLYDRCVARRLDDRPGFIEIVAELRRLEQSLALSGRWGD